MRSLYRRVCAHSHGGGSRMDEATAPSLKRTHMTRNHANVTDKVAAQTPPPFLNVNGVANVVDINMLPRVLLSHSCSAYTDIADAIELKVNGVIIEALPAGDAAAPNTAVSR